MNVPDMIFLIAVSVVLPISVLTLLFSYQKTRLKAKRSTGENELTTSELQGMIDGAVVDATAELEQRVESLEQQLLLLGPASQDEATPVDAGSKTLGGITRE